MLSYCRYIVSDAMMASSLSYVDFDPAKWQLCYTHMNPLVDVSVCVCDQLMYFVLPGWHR